MSIMEKIGTDLTNRKLDPTQRDKLQKLQDIEYPEDSQVQNRPFQSKRISLNQQVLTAVHRDKSARKGTIDICSDYLTAIKRGAIEDMKIALSAGESCPRNCFKTSR
jgi:predicted DNA binding CopG/RHH family protein